MRGRTGEEARGRTGEEVKGRTGEEVRGRTGEEVRGRALLTVPSFRSCSIADSRVIPNE